MQGTDLTAPARPGRSTLWLQGLGCGALLTFAAPMALLLSVLFAPVALCSLAETGPRHSLRRPVALACAGAALHPAWRLWSSGDRMDQALSSLADPATLILAWGAGACAWAACQVTPVVLAGIWEWREAARARAIRAEIASLAAAWDVAAEDK
jgi:hypothetical protein